jgi:hypothetical protein
VTSETRDTDRILAVGKKRRNAVVIAGKEIAL